MIHNSLINVCFVRKMLLFHALFSCILCALLKETIFPADAVSIERDVQLTRFIAPLTVLRAPVQGVLICGTRGRWNTGWRRQDTLQACSQIIQRLEEESVYLQLQIYDTFRQSTQVDVICISLLRLKIKVRYFL